MIFFGIDNLLRQNVSWKKKNIALLTNHAATTNKLIPSRKALLDKGFNIVKLFSPEHGLYATGPDGKKMNDGIDPLTHLPIISLYNKKLAPTKKDLNDIDIVLFDIPDIGCRCYTYLWTMTYVLEACATYKKKFIILDRPNPISGNLKFVEGPMLDEKKCSSFIGRWNIPLRHSCTIGELALYFNETKNINADIEIIKCKHWKRNMFYPDWKIEFMPTSPAMQSFEAMLLYPGTVLLEATNISEGRGTNLSFTIAGAPWMNKSLLVNQFYRLLVKKNEITFIPKESKYKNEKCFGVEFRTSKKFHSVQNGLLFIKLVKDLFPNHFEWKPYPTNVNPTGKNHLDKLLGIYKSELLLEIKFSSFSKKIKTFTDCTKWKKEIKKYLLY